MQPRKKRLNIYNSDRKYNANLMDKREIADKIKVTRLNEEDVEKDMDVLAEASRRIPMRDDKEYIVYQEKYGNDGMIEKLIAHSGGMTYYTNTVAPYWVIEQLAGHPNSQIIYGHRTEYSAREVVNIQTAFKATQVVIDVPVVIPLTNPNQVMLSLEPLKTVVDEVHLSFPPLHKNEFGERNESYYTKKEDGLWHCHSSIKYDFMKYVQTSLAIWAMNLFILYEDQEDYDKLYEYINADLNAGNPKRKKRQQAKKEGVR